MYTYKETNFKYSYFIDNQSGDNLEVSEHEAIRVVNPIFKGKHLFETLLINHPLAENTLEQLPEEPALVLEKGRYLNHLNYYNF